MKKTLSNDNNTNIKNKTTYLILSLVEKLKKKKNKKDTTKTLLIIGLCIIGISHSNNCLAEDNTPLATETYNFSSSALQYNPTTQTWDSNTNNSKKKKNKKNKKQTETNYSNHQTSQTNNPVNYQPQTGINTYQQPASVQNYHPQPVYQQQIQRNYTTNNQPTPQANQQYYTPQTQYYYPKQNNYYQRYNQQILIPSGTPISAYVEKLIDADDVNEGQEVLLRVQQPVKVQGITVIQANTPIIANVIEHKNNFIFGVPGRIAVGNFKIKLPDGNVLNLSGSIQHKGQNRYWVDFVAWFFLWPMIFIKGEDGKIQAGVQQMLYTNGDAYVTY